MKFETQLDLLSPLVEMLVERSDPLVRDRILVEAVRRLAPSCSVALWREVHVELETGWIPILQRGDPRALPGERELRAVADGELAGGLAGGKRVAVAGARGRRCALALGAGEPDEDAFDLIEALLVVFTTTADGRAGHAALDALQAPLAADENGSSDPASQERRGVLHDLSNQLCCIRTTQDLLEEYGEGLGARERMRFLDSFDQGCERAGDLVARALDAAPPATPAHPGLAEVVRDAVEAEAAAMRRAEVGVEVELEPGVEALAPALDELQLARVVHNLLRNAREALQGETIRQVRVRVVTARRTGRDGIALSVEDSGPGIPEDCLESVFEFGFTRGKPRGSGMGLAVVRELAAAVGGCARAENLARRGARVVVWVPRADNPVSP